MKHIDPFDLENLARSAFESALAFGVSLNSFVGLAQQIEKRVHELQVADTTEETPLGWQDPTKEWSTISYERKRQWLRLDGSYGACAREYTKALYGKPSEPQVTSVVLSDDEMHFLKAIIRNPGCKLNGGESRDAEGNQMWDRLEGLGLITCVGGYKWRPTFDAIALGVRAAINDLAKPS